MIRYAIAINPLAASLYAEFWGSSFPSEVAKCESPIQALLLMAEVLHHLGCMKPYK